MIEINQPKHGFMCQNCFEKDGVKELNFHTGSTGIIIRLCENCRKELFQRLDDDFKEEEQAENQYREEMNQIAEMYGG